MRRLVIVGCLLIGAVIGVGAVTTAGALDRGDGRRPWPDHALRVAVTDQAWLPDVQDAVSTLNRVPADLHIQLVKDPGQADVIVKTISQKQMDRQCDAHQAGNVRMVCAGQASHIGYRGRQETIWLVKRGESSELGLMGLRRLAEHEISHVLGLAHQDRGCSLMSPYAGARGCRENAQFRLCGPTIPDVAALQDLYGPRPRRYSPYCSLWVDRIPAPLEMTRDGRWINRWLDRPARS